MTRTPTEQERFWAGAFGDDYIARNRSDQLLAGNLRLFVHALRGAGRIDSVIEFGANVGMNLRALALLYPGQAQFGVEINPTAAAGLRALLGAERVFEGAIQDFAPAEQADLALIKGVLIHLHPDSLPGAYDALAAAARRHVMICEYYNPTPVAIPYRGHEDRLFKRDFCGEFMDRHPDFALVDYGFAYRRDPAFPLDDVTWFLLTRKG